MCTEITEEHLLVVHHEMGHIQYYIQYKDQPAAFREGANSGFHEAIGDIMSLSVGTNKHLEKIGLKKPEKLDEELMINTLMNKALQNVAFLPFGFLIDQYRWNIFQGKTKPKDYNCEWWRLRESYQGIEPPVDRTEDDFDAAAKYHVASNTPYVRYFVSAVLQLQFHEALCREAGEYDPNIPEKQYLHECDIYQSTKAGNLLKKMLQLGGSKPWPDALEIVTGKRYMDASSLLNYFKPLNEWLKKENEKTGEFIGWKPSLRINDPKEKGDSPSKRSSMVKK